MAVWTISRQAGIGAEQCAREVAERAGVPLVEHEIAQSVALRLGLSTPELADELERHPPGALLKLGLNAAVVLGRGEAVRELQLLESLREAIEAAIVEVARYPCVILGHGAFAVLADHPGAVHVRIRAPFAWRVERYARDQLLDRGRAEHELRRADRLRACYLRRLYGTDGSDLARFDLVCDASRLAPDRLVETILAAGGRRAEAPAYA
jgi:cytidylate kinase